MSQAQQELVELFEGRGPDAPDIPSERLLEVLKPVLGAVDRAPDQDCLLATTGTESS